MHKSNKALVIKWLLFISAAFLIGILAACAGFNISLPDRSKCTRAWEQGKECVSNVDCNESLDEVCAHRGHPTGHCVIIDCCDPWRGNGSSAFGDDWCKKETPSDDENFQPVKKTPELQQ